MKPPTITAYLKPTCGWSQGVRAVMRPPARQGIPSYRVVIDGGDVQIEI